MWNKNIKNKPKNVSWNGLDGFSRILGIIFFPGEAHTPPPGSPLKNGIHGVNPHFTKHFLLTTTTNQPRRREMGGGGMVQTRNLRDLGSTVENAHYLSSRPIPPK